MRKHLQAKMTLLAAQQAIKHTQCNLILYKRICCEAAGCTPLQAAQQRQVHSADGWSEGAVPDAVQSSRQEDGLAGLLLPHGHLVMKLLQVMLIQPALELV